MTGAEIALVVGAAAATYSAYTSYQSGRDAQKAANLQAGILEQNAEAARKAAAADASQFARDESRAAGRLRALIGGSGAVTGTGTPLLIEEDRAAEAELQRLKILHGGEISASQLTSQASLERAGGTAARRRGEREAFSRLLTGGGRVVDRGVETGAFGL